MSVEKQVACACMCIHSESLFSPDSGSSVAVEQHDMKSELVFLDGLLKFDQDVQTKN